MIRLLCAATVLIVTALLPSILAQPPQTPPPFTDWLVDLMAEARARGFSDALVTEALSGVKPREQVITQDRNQAEVIQTLDQYMERRVSPAMVDLGRDLLAQHTTLLERIEREYGVQRRFILAIWGMESRFGQFTGGVPVFQALATLAWDPRRATLFRGELFNALRIVANGDITVPAMTGSWAGAMGQSQFLPSSYLQLAVDADGDGRRDIWTSTADSLGSIANYLRNYGWQRQFTWGREVQTPVDLTDSIPARSSGGCPGIRRMTERRALTEWQQLGVRRMGGIDLPQVDILGSLIQIDGRNFLVYDNYDALMRYNCVHRYALSVAMFAEQLR